eukprot:SAG31_NODE_238_length_19470_cov_8.921532_12_plen_804_part_01
MHDVELGTWREVGQILNHISNSTACEANVGGEAEPVGLEPATILATFSLPVGLNISDAEGLVLMRDAIAAHLHVASPRLFLIAEGGGPRVNLVIWECEHLMYANPYSTTSILLRTLDDDTATGNTTSYVTHRFVSNDTNYARAGRSAELMFEIQDDDLAGVIINSRGPVVLTEAPGAQQSASYTVVLATLPQHDVHVNISTIAPQLAIDPTTLRFNAETWNVPQEVTVTCINNDVDDGNDISVHILHQIVSTLDSMYAALEVTNLTVQVIENDHAGIILSSLTISLTEGADSGTNYSLELASQPTAPVTVSISLPPAAAGRLVVQPVYHFLFEPGTWDVPQMFDVFAVDNHFADGIIILDLEFHFESNDSLYNELHLPPPGSPNCNVCGMFTFRGDAQDQAFLCRCEPTNLASTSASLLCTETLHGWLLEGHSSHDGGTVDSCAAVGGRADPYSCLDIRSVIESETDERACTAYQQLYGAQCCADILISDSGFYAFRVSVEDNDMPGVVTSDENIVLAEGAAAKYVCVRLSSQPRYTVSVLPYLQPLDECRACETSGSALDVAPTVNGGESNEQQFLGSWEFSASWDDVSESSQPQTLPAPFAHVADFITIDGVETAQVDSIQLEFNESTWNHSSCFRVRADDDTVAEQTMNFRVYLSMSSRDSKYANRTELGADVVVIDDDRAGIDTQTSDLVVSEDGATTTYILRLLSQPLRRVDVIIAGVGHRSGPDLAISPVSLVFEPESWNHSQQIIVSVVDDDIFQGRTDMVLSHALPRASVEIAAGLNGQATVIEIHCDVCSGWTYL